MLCQRIEEHVFEAVVVAATANAGVLRFAQNDRCFELGVKVPG
jgi:hypothetical protein